MRILIATQTLRILGIISCVGLFSACDMMGGLYDDTLDGNPESDVPSAESRDGQLYLDARSYTNWIYIDLHGEEPVFTVSTINPADYSETGVPEQWDIAVHHYDVKTNGAAVMMTACRSIEQVESEGMPTEGTWVEDEYSEESVWFDLSNMLEGYIVYAPGYKNTEAGKWLDVDITYMPPTYTMRDNVMLFRFTDGTYAAIQLCDYMSADKYRTKGWITLNYRYPIFQD